MDIFSVNRRSEIMAAIRSSGTKPERLVLELTRRLVRQELGRSTRILANATFVPGTPDVYVPSLRLALFVDGCFFHGCPIHGHIPKSNKRYWTRKLIRNVRRDDRVRRNLRRNGLSVWRFWEHELRRTVVERCEAKLLQAILRAKRRHKAVSKLSGS